jgi:hypothetical protein
MPIYRQVPRRPQTGRELVEPPLSANVDPADYGRRNQLDEKI